MFNTGQGYDNDQYEDQDFYADLPHGLQGLPQANSFSNNGNEEDLFLSPQISPSGSFRSNNKEKKKKCVNPFSIVLTWIKNFIWPPHPLCERGINYSPLNKTYQITNKTTTEEIVQEYPSTRSEWLTKLNHTGAFSPNVVKNTKYTIFSFLPVFFYNEFRFFFNLYFLIVALTQFIPALQVGFLFTYVSPLCMVLGVSMCKELYDDLKRYRRDTIANNELISVFIPSHHDKFELMAHDLKQFSQFPAPNHQSPYGKDDPAPMYDTNQPSIELSTSASPILPQKANPGAANDDENAAFLEDTHSLVTIKVPSRALQPGDIILLHPQQRVPCDCVLLKAFDKSGTLFLKTDQLDGETDWKLRRPPTCTQTRMWGKYESQYNQGSFTINAEAPKLDIYDFQGNIEAVPHVDHRSNNNNNNNNNDGRAVLEGLSLENTLWSNTTVASCHALAMVIYTGKDSRSALNANQPRTKTGALDMEVNQLSKILFCLTITLAFIMVCLKGFYGLWYVYLFRYVLLFSSIIPISLRVNLDMAKLLYSYQINNDKSIPETVVRTSTIPEELGRVSYIFSDKTGTLTTNCMFFKVLQLAPPLVYNTDTIDALKYHIAQSYSTYGGKNYVGMPAPKKDVKKDDLITDNSTANIPTAAVQKTRGLLSYDLDSDINAHLLAPNNQFTPQPDDGKKVNVAPAMTSPVPNAQVFQMGGLSSAETQKQTRRMMEAIILCHNVTPTTSAPQAPVQDGEFEKEKSGIFSSPSRLPPSSSSSSRTASKLGQDDEDEGEATKYQASSPDEIALVSFADEMGMTLTYRDTQTMTFTTPYGDDITYQILAVFPFTSASKRMGIIVKDADGVIYYYVKGAESIIIPKCIPNPWVTEEVSNLARIGLRTLVYAWKTLTPNEYQVFNQKLTAAKASLSNRDDHIQAAIESLEINLFCVGITGVEDKLQDDIRTTLETLRNAGIKVWMLTGDKNETAACIGLSTRLVERGQKIITIQCTNRREAAVSLDNASKYASTSCLLIDGPSLQVLLDTFPIEFLEIACTAPSVICCRCSPTQKAQVVTQMKEFTGKRCLAIGDGGNDVSMIQAANVGVGIVGKEGQQAAMSADFSITQFSYLAYLLLWHGRNSYKRSASLSQFIMHRGMIISIIQAVFCALYFYVAVPIYTGWLLVGYTTVYTMLPVFSLVLDTDVSKQTTFIYPELYRALQMGKPLSIKTFFLWVLLSIYQGSVIMILGMLLFSDNFINVVSITFTALILCELFNVVLSIKTWVKFMVYSLLGSALLYIISIFALTTYFDITFVLTIEFIWKVAFITAVACIPPALIQFAARKLNPGEHLKVASNN
jgi:phospholipid-translocating ATPase